MKLTFTKTVLGLSLIGLSTSVLAQDTSSDTTQRTHMRRHHSDTTALQKKTFRTFSIGINGGVLTHYTPFNGPSNGDFKTPEEKLGYGGYLKEQILPGFGIQADFLAGKVNGFRANSLPAGSDAQANSSFESQIAWSAALSGNFTIANLSLKHRHGLLSPYFTAGAGYMSSSANVRNTPVGANSNYDGHWFVPVGAGFKIGIAEALNIDLGYTVYFMKTNNFDGVPSGLNDRFSYAHAGLEFSLGKKHAPQLQNYSALADLREQTAAEAERNALERQRLRAQLAAQAATAEQNRLADQQQYAKDFGDDDSDGVANKFDKCPGTPANTPVDGSGCPIKVVAPVITKVIITEEDRKVVGDAIKNLEFDLGKATIKEKSYETLDRVAGLLVQKNFSLKLAGHTDNSGSVSVNMKLSKDRAEAVKAYLVSKGANASRIEATGYGSAQPITTNKTAAGRQQNRRVEFSLL